MKELERSELQAEQYKDCISIFLLQRLAQEINACTQVNLMSTGQVKSLNNNI